MPDSILDTTKKVLGIDADYKAFDTDIIMHINSVFSTLNQLGVGPKNGFAISDSVPEWSNYLVGNDKINNVKSYMYMRVRLMFDPPATSYTIDSLDRQAKEMEWRLQVELDPIVYETLGGN